ncbi:hypothetical protein SAMN04489712_103103 [Thermomonospora echinospora]|uniref:Secreted protein n=1 Tax=Thermomonospora echinospora TaxID=1992 RepID=A0A1H5X799_9ACTN|nr:DUF6493 family protein [Thermomonospora echinospora]SEG07166.1 hypothetical protein SAMN04489712_103103 [Thermomonospora echinospora]
MTDWNDLQKAITAGRQERVADLILAMGPEDRHAAADALPGLLRKLREKHGRIDRHPACALLLAGAGTIGGPAAAATWVCRADLRFWWVSGDQARRPARLLARLVEQRTPQWRAEFTRRLADRLRPPGSRSQDEMHWHIVARLVLDTGDEPPAGDAFVAGWVEWGAEPGRLIDDPFLDAMVPRMFEADGIGALLQWDPVEAGGTRWAPSLVRLARDGRLKREMLLDGCVRRFLRGGRANELRWFAGLHDLLEPTVEEATARLRDYVRLLPAAPGPVAELALREVRRADDARALDEASFTEAAESLLFRPEKKLVGRTLSWLDRTARGHDRVDATLRAVTTAFVSENLDLRERAVKIAAKHAGRAGEDARQAVRDAAADLPADLRALVAGSCGALDDAPFAPPLVPEPPPFVPRRPPAPIASPEELVEELVVQIREHSWSPLERLLAGVVEQAHRNPEGTQRALRRIMPEVAPWALDERTLLDGDYPAVYLAAGARAVVMPEYRHPTSASMAAFLHEMPESRRREPYRHRDQAIMHRFLVWRTNSAVRSVGRLPTLLAAPTEANGHIDPGTLVARMALLEEAGVEPDVVDLNQALLRVPREIDSGAVARARLLSSPAGQTLANWLATGGLPDMTVTCRPVTMLERVYQGYPSYGYQDVPRERLLATVTPPPGIPHVMSRLCGLTQDGNGTHKSFGHYFYGETGSWPSLLPSHREVTAAHLMPYLPEWVDGRHGQGATLLALAEADGPAGPATATALAYGLAAQHQQERSGAVDALLAFCGRGHLPAAELGTALATLVDLEGLKLNRVTEALGDATRAGAHADVWTAIAAALPGLLPAPGERPATGLADLIALGTQAVEGTGARGHIPELAAVAARGGSSRLVREAARLHRSLTP